MKRLLVLMTLSFLLVSCSIRYNYNIGQSSSEFAAMNKRGVKNLDLVRQSTEWAVYRTKGDGNPIFFYFRNDKLVQVDRGERGPDVIIQNNSRRLN